MFGNRQPGPGGLSINTNTANSVAGSAGQPPKSGGLFGSVQQSKPAGSLFGGAAATSQPQSNLLGQPNAGQGGGLFGATTNTTQQPGNSLFGTPTASQNTGIFGSSMTAAQPQQRNSLSGGSLFGGQGSSNQQTQGGGHFGGSSTQQGGGLFSQSNQLQNTSLFGSTTTQQAQPQQQSGGLFASMGQKQSQPQNTGLFGSSVGQDKPNPLFGSSTLQTQGQPQQQQTQQPAPSIFANSIGQLSQQQQTVPGVRISINELRPTTRFNDLHEDLQRFIENINNFVLEQMKFQNQCEQAINGDDGVKNTSVLVPGEVQSAHSTLDAVQQALENDAHAIAHVKTLNKGDHKDAMLSFKAASSLRVPQQFQHSSFRHTTNTPHAAGASLIDDDGAATDLVSYFTSQTNEMANTLDIYRSRLAGIDTYLNGIEVSMVDQMQQLIFLRGQDGIRRNAEDQVKELAAVLKEMQSGIAGVAGKLSVTRERVQGIIVGQENNDIMIRRARRY